MSKLTNLSKGKSCIRCDAKKIREKAYRLFKDRFKQSVIVDKKTGCHIWQGAKAGVGYGYVTLRLSNLNKKNFYIHRLVCEFQNGKKVDELVVMHSCDNPACCNPKHLSVGTASKNTQDMIKKNRHPKHMKKGKSNPIRKLTDEQVELIINSDLSLRALAKELNVHHSTVWRTKKNRANV